jgi:uncharacterized membrane protein YeaQ/YmgE (transglycosylase-associated protein family)
MNILAWLVVGLIGGLVARLLVSGRQPSGILITILVGIVGALLGGYLSVQLGMGNGIDNFDAGTVALSVVGAVLILLAYQVITSRGRLI